MSAVGLEGLEHSVQLTHIWINDLDERLGWDAPARSFRLLKAVLHVLRDWLPTVEAAQLAAQLPTLLRGAFYEQWRPALTPVKHGKRADFVARVEEAFQRDPLAHPTANVMCVFELLSDKVTGGEIADVRATLPGDVRELWPERYVMEGALR